MCNSSIASEVSITNDILTTEIYFPTLISTVVKTNFLDAARSVCLESLKKVDSVDEIYPVKMSENLINDERLSDLMTYIGQTSWNILEGQGYNTTNMSVLLTDFWCQEHSKHSLMEQHVHGHGSQLVGFYFIDVPENSSSAVFHDPRSGKVQSSLREADAHNVTPASINVHFKPVPGLLVFSNAWLPHSFSRHRSEDPIRFIHFSVTVQYDAPSPCQLPAAEII
jgi:hypothetical protein